MRERWDSLVALVRITVAASPWLAATELLLVVVMAVAGPLQAYGVARIVNAVTGQGSVTAGAIILFGALAVAFGGLVLSDAVRHRLEDGIEIGLQSELLDLATKPPGIGHHEQPEIADRLGAAREEFRRLKGTAGTIGSGLAVLITTATVLVLLAGIHPLLLTLPLLGVLRLWASAYGARQFRHAITVTMEYNRRQAKLLDVVSHPGHGLEVRAFGLRGMLTDKIAEQFRLQNGPRWRARRQGHLLEIAARVLFGLAYGAAIVFVLWLARAGRATPGDVTMVMLLAPQTDQAAQRLSDSVRVLIAMLDVAGHIQWLRRHLGHQVAWAGAEEPPTTLRHGIELRNVSFAYPAAERPVLRDLSVYLPAGSTVALVGDNGAGKTTMVKLLARLYDPTDGSILVDGADLRAINHQAWRSRISAGFQDFVRYEYTAREAIGLGEPSRLGGPTQPRAGAESEVRTSGDAFTDDSYDAAIDAGDARAVIDRLPDGLDTRLGKRFGGTQLSGGQWQRLALARAFMRERPLLVLLDEPAAALDPETEHALLDRFNAASTATRETGGITLLVSHRLSTVRMADLILVFENGELTESGSHEDLMATGGSYAELFELQASAYR
ncbi:ABC transporter ATP-binding protein [Actinopolymorpha pittospori]|uniref:ATP-binding cassette subfamily B protein n=1 Tax=Actinopolymorpha pittospori TaxID=648752 RepID=A0A927MSX6_9ACTN|nr:ABC transporter ATP-binding protein [Actinopolymorpha pittospori]MBE1605741.1 ATP-binding cassette subfamily B protein [Actinopolymorpha pittospori]